MNIQLFQHQETETSYKQNTWQKTVMVLTIAMVKRIGAYAERKRNHPRFKKIVMNQVHSK